MKKVTVLVLSFCLFTPIASAQGLRVDGTPYVDLVESSLALSLRYDWDPITRNATITGPRGDARFHVGSKYVLADGRLEHLSSEVKIHRGSVVAPLEAEPLLARLKIEAKAESEAAAPAAAQTHLPARRARVILDPGHGGSDTGAMSLSGVPEKEIVLRVAERVKERLEREGYEVFLTRETDVFVPLSERARFANGKNADLFVSVHANAAEAETLEGFETYTLSEDVDDSLLARARADHSPRGGGQFADARPSELTSSVVWDLVQAENRRESSRLAKEISSSVGHWVDAGHHRRRDARFYVLKWSESPAVLVELGYLTNHGNEAKLRDPFFQRRIGEAVAEGILRHERAISAKGRA